MGHLHPWYPMTKNNPKIYEFNREIIEIRTRKFLSTPIHSKIVPQEVSSGASGGGLWNKAATRLSAVNAFNDGAQDRKFVQFK